MARSPPTGPETPPRAAPRVLVVQKKSLLELSRRDAKFTAAVVQGHPLGMRALAAHADNERTVEIVRQTIERLGVLSQVVPSLRREMADHAALVVTVGGDGTFLDASHHVGATPVLGVNSSPRSSVGHFCGATPDTLERCLEDALAGRAAPQRLPRIVVRVNDHAFPARALNDILFSHAVPAATTRYRLQRAEDGAGEEQVSSGIWFSTAAGATAAIASAGGLAMDPRDTRLQFLVRELYHEPGRSYVLTGGFASGPLVVTSRVRAARLYLDGPRTVVRVGFADRIELTIAPDDFRYFSKSSLRA